MVPLPRLSAVCVQALLGAPSTCQACSHGQASFVAGLSWRSSKMPQNF